MQNDIKVHTLAVLGSHPSPSLIFVVCLYSVECADDLISVNFVPDDTFQQKLHSAMARGVVEHPAVVMQAEELQDGNCDLRQRAFDIITFAVTSHWGR